MAFINGLAIILGALAALLFGIGAAGFGVGVFMICLGSVIESDDEEWHTPRFTATLHQKVHWPFGEEIEADEVKTE